MDGFFLQQNVNVVGSRESGAFASLREQEPTSSSAAAAAAVLVDRRAERNNDTGHPNHAGPGGDTIYLTADGNGEVVHLGYLEGTSGVEAEAEAEAAVDDSRRRRKPFTMRDPREESHHRLAPLGEVESGDDSDCVVVASTERKVEPLKINLARDREPIRTIIKLTPGSGSVVDHHSACSQPLSPTIREVPGSPKITIKPPKPPPSLVEAGGSSSSTGGGGLHQNSNSVMSQSATANAVMSSSSSSSSIPKLTIKPVINPTEELLTVEAPSEQMQIIPKLLIKGSSLEATAHGPTEPHIVPKLTIRGVNNHNHHLHHHHHHNHHLQQQQQQQQLPYHYLPFVQVSQESSQHYSSATGSDDGTGLLVAAGSPTTPSTPLVPKLTIKMDNHHPHHHHHHVQQQNSVGGGPGGSGGRVESPIPKLHIKAIPPETAAGGGGGGAGSSSQSQSQSPPASSSLGMATAGTSGANSLTSSEGVKLTIKPLPEPPKLPKLTIKTTGLGTIAETSDASLVSSTSCSFSPKLLPSGGPAVGSASGANNSSHELQQHHHQHHAMHLLTVAQQQPASPSDQHSNISSSSIPKLTIKPFSPKIAVIGQQQQQQQSPTGSSSQMPAAGGAEDLPQVVPKLTIKPIPAPPASIGGGTAMKQSTGEDSNSSSETSINSLESSPVSSSSSSSSSSLSSSQVMTTSPSALRMTIKVPPPAQQDAHSIGGSTSTLGVQTSSSSGGPVVTKLNIKPILPPAPSPITGEGGVGDGLEHSEAIVSHGGDSSPPSEAEPDPSAAPIVIPKVTIKTLAHPRSQETEILSTPKVTLRPIPKPTGHDTGFPPGSPGVGQQPIVERQSPQAAGGPLNSNNSPTAGMTASDGGGSMDSPRIILKINKGSSSTTTSMEQQQQQQLQSEGMDTKVPPEGGIPTPPTGGSSILANELKRPAATAAPPGVGSNSSAFSSASSSSLSSASSTTVSVSTTSSSVGSDPASPSSSAGGGDQGDPGSPEAKKSKLDPLGATMPRVVKAPPQQQLPFINSDHNAALRQSLLLNHQQQQQQLQQLQKAQQQQQQKAAGGQSAAAAVSDVIVIDDDSKSENESMRGEVDPVSMPMVTDRRTVGGQQLLQLPEQGSFMQQPFYSLMNNNDAATVTTAAARAGKPRRTRGPPRGTARGAGGGTRGRQSRRGAASDSGPGAVLAQENSTVSAEAPRLIPARQNHDDHDEGSSSDCMIVDDPATTVGPSSATPAARSGGISLESLLLGKQPPPSLYNATTTSMAGGGAGPGSGEVEKNGTASNSSIGSVSSSSIGGGTVPTPPAPPATTATPGGAVRMSTRRGAGQLLKEVLANKHHDRDSGVDDEAKTDGEGGSGGGGPLGGGPTSSKRPRGRPKKQSVDLTMETTNGGGSSSSMDGNGAPDSNMMMMLAMMGAAGGGEGGLAFLRPDGLGAQSLMEGIMPLPITPVRTPRTRGRGRGRGRGKLALMEGTIDAQSPTLDAYDATRRNFALPAGNATAEGNGDPLFIDATTTDTANFNLLFNHVQTPRGGVRTRGGRRGTGARGARTPRGGGRGASKAAKAAAAAAAALLDSTPGLAELAGFASPAGVSLEAAVADPLQFPSPGLLPSGVSPPMAETPVRRARAARGAGAASKRKEPSSGRKAPRGKKAREAAALLAAAVSAAAAAELSPIRNAANSTGATNNTIFMTPMAGGLDFNRLKLHVRELKTPKNAVKSNTPPSSAQTTPLAGTPGETTPGGGLQVFEEDTRMSGDFNFTTPVRLMMGSGDGCLQTNEESQSSYLSSTSVTQDAATAATVSAGAGAIGGQPQLTGVTEAAGGAPEAASLDAQKEALAGAISSTSNSSSSTRRPTKGKMEVLDAHRAAFTVELLAEYEWPPPSPGTRGTDTFMLQEQIAEYLGVKSFKRKYPDLMRRPVDMEERNFVLEQGLASEKMCDLGLTAVYASEILDIMCTDYPEKYEEYTRYTREKHFRELSNRQQRQQQEAASAAVAAVAAAPVDRVQLQKEKAIESASSWNCSFNKERRDTRRACMDLQTYVVQVPKRYQPPVHQSQQPRTKPQEPSNYPVALVPGQFSEYYTTFTPEELACYPINTILLDPVQMREIVSSERYRQLVAEEEARLRAMSDEDDSSSSDDDSDTGSSSSSGSSDEDGSSSDSSSNSSSSSSNSSTTSSARSGSPNNDDCGPRDVKKELDRRKRTDLADGEKNDESEEKAASTSSAFSVGGPVRRSSRALSAGTVVPPPTAVAVEIKDPTDSDDSDVPLIAHAVRRRNLLSGGGATVANNTTSHPSVGGGKRMQETLSPPVKRPPVNPFMCAVCLGPENKNKYSQPERYVRCNRCRRKAHPSCIGMSAAMYRRVQQYKWQCSECKLCMKCNRSPAAIDSKMVYCDQCDRGFHLACKGLRNLPEGRWHCSLCTLCGQCGARTPEGHPNPHLNAQQRQHLAMVAEWTHEYGLNELTKIREHLRTLCVPCVRIRRQRLQHPDQTPSSAAAAVTTGNGETKPILNNNNNNNLSDHLKQQQPVGVSGAAMVGATNKPQSQLMMHTSSMKQQPHTTVVVQTGSGLPNSHHLPGETKGPMTGEVRR